MMPPDGLDRPRVALAVVSSAGVIGVPLPAGVFAP